MLIAALLLMVPCEALVAQSIATPAAPSTPPAAADEAAVLAVADSALESITNEDFERFTDLMVDSATLYSGADQDGLPGYTARTRAEQRATTTSQDIVERGFDPEVRVAGSIAMVWYPYDLYIDGEWSHCGVDLFSLVRTAAGWRIASMSWSVEQPPACRPHPDGPVARSPVAR
jgi:hypothetical protein